MMNTGWFTKYSRKDCTFYNAAFIINKKSLPEKPGGKQLKLYASQSSVGLLTIQKSIDGRNLSVIILIFLYSYFAVKILNRCKFIITEQFKISSYISGHVFILIRSI